MLMLMHLIFVHLFFSLFAVELQYSDTDPQIKLGVLSNRCGSVPKPCI
ncbi:Uncharacterised protein [Yersinia massiliensis]|nr:Uncharacterised protein [Yersinia massiliensis]